MAAKRAGASGAVCTPWPSTLGLCPWPPLPPPDHMAWTLDLETQHTPPEVHPPTYWEAHDLRARVCPLNCKRTLASALQERCEDSVRSNVGHTSNTVLGPCLLRGFGAWPCFHQPVPPVLHKKFRKLGVNGTLCTYFGMSCPLVTVFKKARQA